MEDHPGLGCALMLGSTFVTLVFGSIMDGWVLATLWRWFIMPLFEVPALTLLEAIGLCLIVGYLTVNFTQAKDERESTEKVADALTRSFVYPLVVLGVSYVVHRFM